MIKIITCLALILFAGFTGSSVFAEEPQLNPDRPDTYYVKKGDTLWDISKLFLLNPWAWPDIWVINDEVGNPHLIYPGDELSLLYVEKDGKSKPTLTVTKRKVESKLVKLSPKTRASFISSTIPTIPSEKIESFLRNSRVVDKRTLLESPYIVAAGDSRLVMGRGDVLYGRGDWENVQAAYGIYRAGKPYVDPDTKEILGYEAKDLGLAKFMSVEDEIATMSIATANEEIRVYDKLIVSEARRIDANYYPKTPNNEIEGKIIHVFSGAFHVGQYDVVVTNRGTREGVEKGDVFAIYRKGEITRDRQTHNQKIQLPSERAGLLMIFRTYEKVSLGLVLRATDILSVGDEIRQP